MRFFNWYKQVVRFFNKDKTCLKDDCSSLQKYKDYLEKKRIEKLIEEISKS